MIEGIEDGVLHLIAEIGEVEMRGGWEMKGLVMMTEEEVVLMTTGWEIDVLIPEIGEMIENTETGITKTGIGTEIIGKKVLL